MKPIAAILLLAVPLLASCASPRKPYTPSKGFEEIEYRHGAVGVYPDDVRADAAKFTNQVVVWAGIIKDTRARDLLTGNFEVTTQVEHHYFDWKEARNASEGKYFVSPRGEGAFTFTWESRRKNAIATTADVDQYAAPGKMVVVYGIPKSVDSNGVITLNYRFMRIIEPAECNFYTSNYGRAGEAVKSTGK
jgi:hypothetical protein